MAGFDDASPVEIESPDFHGHRKRLKDRFRAAGADGLGQHELLELILFSAFPRRDTKPLARVLLKRFGSFAEVISASPERLKEVDGVGDSAITALKIVEAAAQQLLRGQLKQRFVLTSWSAMIDYCRSKMAFATEEEFRVIFLDKRNSLLGDEVMGTGTIDHAPVYPREVIKRALELSATALVLVHNHPSGDPAPSSADVQTTKQIVALARPFGIEIHDHIIVGKQGHASLRKLKLI